MDKERLKKEAIQLVQTFFQEEQGNRVTSNNMEGLIGRILRLIDEYEPPKKGKEV